jgi:hypothetical protein
MFGSLWVEVGRSNGCGDLLKIWPRWSMGSWPVSLWRWTFEIGANIQGFCARCQRTSRTVPHQCCRYCKGTVIWINYNRHERAWGRTWSRSDFLFVWFPNNEVRRYHKRRCLPEVGSRTSRTSYIADSWLYTFHSCISRWSTTASLHIDTKIYLNAYLPCGTF